MRWAAIEAENQLQMIYLVKGQDKSRKFDADHSLFALSQFSVRNIIKNMPSYTILLAAISPKPEDKKASYLSFSGVSEP